LIYPLLILYLASLVSNEMIVYPAPIRFIFFVFVLTICSLFSPATVILVFYYLVKAGYSYYRNELEDRDGDTTEIRIYPRIFAILPIATTPATSLIGRFFKYPFYYPKTEEDRKVLERTDGKGGSIMDEYMEVLKESFPYGETVKGSEPFAERYATIEKNMKRIHQAPVAVSAVPDSSTVSTKLPPTIGSKDTSISSLLPSVLPKASSNLLNAPKALPAVIASKAAGPNASNASKALPAVITPTSTSADILNVMASNGSKIPAPKADPKIPTMPAVIASPQWGGAIKTRSPTSGGWLWNGI